MNVQSKLRYVKLYLKLENSLLFEMNSIEYKGTRSVEIFKHQSMDRIFVILVPVEIRCLIYNIFKNSSGRPADRSVGIQIEGMIEFLNMHRSFRRVGWRVFGSSETRHTRRHLTLRKQ